MQRGKGLDETPLPYVSLRRQSKPVPSAKWGAICDYTIVFRRS